METSATELPPGLPEVSNPQDSPRRENGCPTPHTSTTTFSSSILQHSRSTWVRWWGQLPHVRCSVRGHRAGGPDLGVWLGCCISDPRASTSHRPWGPITTYPTCLITEEKGKKFPLPRRPLQIHFPEGRVTFQSLLCMSPCPHQRRGCSCTALVSLSAHCPSLAPSPGDPAGSHTTCPGHMLAVSREGTPIPQRCLQSQHMTWEGPSPLSLTTRCESWRAVQSLGP